MQQEDSTEEEEKEDSREKNTDRCLNRNDIYGNKSSATAGSWMTHEIDYTEVHRTLPNVLLVEAVLREEVCIFFLLLMFPTIMGCCHQRC